MNRSLLSMAIILLQLAASQEAGSAPPDKVANSPVPPLQPPAPKTARTVPSSLLPVPIPDQVIQPTVIPERQQEQKGQQTVDSSASVSEDTDYATDEVELWNSPEMRAARAVVEEFCRRAAHTSPQEGAEFLDKLSQLSPKAMQNWLDRFEYRRRSVSRGNDVGKFARLLNVERSLNKLQVQRQATQNVAELRRQAATARTRQTLQLQFFPVPIDASGMTSLSYNPMEAVVDPSSPRGYRRKVAAAMSLPGDLPRSDPRNYIRGEEGVDFGEWATSKSAVPPTPAPPSTTVP